MLNGNPCFIRVSVFAALLAVTASAQALPGDAAAVAKARQEYAEAMQGHDAGLQNAMRVQLAHQLAEARKRAHHRHPASSEKDDTGPQHNEHDTQSVAHRDDYAER